MTKKRKTSPGIHTPGDDELLFLPLGGTGEIGMNMNLYGHAGQWLMIDLGVAFGEHDLPGIEVVMPDPDFIVERASSLAGLVLTHAHEDHIGAVSYLWPRLRCPVYATPFTAALLRRKFADDKATDVPEIIEVPLSGQFRVGPFDVELVTLTHSIPEPNAVILRSACGTVLHTGDWKLDPDPLVGDNYDKQRLIALADENVQAMICDSTNAMVEGDSGSELDVRAGLEREIAGLKGRVAVACFASNVARLETVMHVAETHGRRVALVGRSMHRIIASAREAGYLQNMPALIDVRDIDYLPREEVLLLCTGSQGEPRAALWRIANGDHQDVELQEGDSVVFSSRVIPGNEKSILALYNLLSDRGINLITADVKRDIHVSGHPCRDELSQMYQWVRPRVAVPVHGEPRHLAAHAALAHDCQVPEIIDTRNGAMVRLVPGPAEVIDHVHSGRLVLDGSVLRELESPVLRMRKRMVFNGSAVLTLVVDDTGDLAADPVLSASGLFDMDKEPQIEDDVLDAVEDALHRLSRQDRGDDDAVGEAARVAARRALSRILGKKPIVEVQVIRLD
ncbi:ribonuclease J [Fodinicurvata sediminis]|uniref:ribonuclease J n=1 Tax=Fodinicurvata sediminis TaxID=1121832 RepID=UPI0003B4EEDC|nr:ribonuclease J [Fodinicurvata sediminis]